MEILSIYKMELYKAFKRKNSWIMIIPSILAVLMALGVANGVLELSYGGTGAMSCMDFVQLIWLLFSGLGIWGILIILVAAFQFSGEISDGQIKMAILRTGKRQSVVIGKFLAVVTVVLGFLVVFFLTAIAGYYLFLANSALGSNAFALTVEGATIGKVLLGLGCGALNFIILIALTFLLGIYINPFAAFVTTLIVMFATNYMAGMESLGFMKYLPYYVSNELLAGTGLSGGHMLTFAICTIVILCAIIGGTTFLFRRRDIK